MIYFTSDLHFGHDREFIWGPRGFQSSFEHDETIIKNWNSLITEEDDVYILGDLMLGDNAAGRKKLAQLRGKLHIIWGNHDTEPRKQIYSTLHNVVQVHGYADILKYKGYTFYMSHFPTMTANQGKTNQIINLCGHYHTKDCLVDWDDFQFPIFHCELDAHKNKPISLEEILIKIKDK